MIPCKGEHEPLLELIWASYTNVLLDVGIPPDQSTMQFVTNTLIKIKQLAHDRLYLSPLVINVVKIQIEAVDSTLADQIKEHFHEELTTVSSHELIDRVWKELIPWHADLTASWASVEQHKRPRMNIIALSGIKGKILNIEHVLKFHSSENGLNQIRL